MTELYQKRCSDCRNYFLGSYWSFVHRCSLCTNRVLVREQEERDEKLRQRLEEINRQFDRPYYNPPVQRQQPARQVYTEELLDEPAPTYVPSSPVTHSDYDDDNNKLARYIMAGILAISFAVAGLYAMFHDPSQKRGLDASIERMNAIANSVNTPATDEKVADAVDRARAVVAEEDEDSKLNAHVTELIKNADKPNSFLAEDDDADDEIEKLADEKIKEL
jgi:hypothetical protein